VTHRRGPEVEGRSSGDSSRRGVSAWLLHPASAAVAAVALRAGVTLWGGRLRAPQVFEMEEQVRNWFGGQGFTYHFLGTDYRSFNSALPYGLLYAGVYGLSGGRPAANLVVQWLCAALLCLVVWQIGTRLGPSPVAGLAAWLAATHPGLVAYDGTRLIQITFDATLMAGALLSFVRWAEHPSVGRAGCAGLLTGLVMYERGTAGLFFPIALFWVKGLSHLSWSRWTRQVAVYGAIATLLLLPWVVRNTLVHGRFVPLMTTTWMALWEGNNEIATGTEFTADGQPIKWAPPPELRERLAGRDELEQMEAFREAALTFIRTQPRGAAELYVRKLGFFWWRSPDTGRWYPGGSVAAYQAWYLVFLGFAVIGVVTLAQGPPRPWAVARLVLWLGLTFSAGQALFYIGGRHRWTIEPVLGLLSAAGAWWVWRRARKPA
jgi:4-amino-4-deoxy-L-arabinose transferase-like glycosyltransferase